jgi:hypothetical protein
MARRHQLSANARLALPADAQMALIEVFVDGCGGN